MSRYWNRYGVVLLTNLREFVLAGEDESGSPVKPKPLRLAASAGGFRSKLEKPRAFQRESGKRLSEYLARALAHRAATAEPKDLAWLLGAAGGTSRVHPRDESSLFALLPQAEAAWVADAVADAIEPGPDPGGVLLGVLIVGRLFHDWFVRAVDDPFHKSLGCPQCWPSAACAGVPGVRDPVDRRRATRIRLPCRLRRGRGLACCSRWDPRRCKARWPADPRHRLQEPGVRDPQPGYARRGSAWAHRGMRVRSGRRRHWPRPR